MKKVCILFTLVVFMLTTSFAQEEIFSAKLAKEHIPQEVIDRILEDFPGYIASGYFGLPMDLVDDIMYMSSSEIIDDQYETYEVRLNGKNGTVRAIYDREGNLLSEERILKDFPLPNNIISAIGRHFPGWALVGNKIMMTSYQGKQRKVHYKVKLKKDDEYFYAVFDANGNLIRGKKRSA